MNTIETVYVIIQQTSLQVPSQKVFHETFSNYSQTRMISPYLWHLVYIYFNIYFPKCKICINISFLLLSYEGQRLLFFMKSQTVLGTVPYTTSRYPSICWTEPNKCKLCIF